jgi:hypothetical protein
MEMQLVDCETVSNTYCNDIKGCYTDYTNCFIAACPPGTDLAEGDETAYVDCDRELVYCIADIDY